MIIQSNLLWRCRRGIREMDLLLQGFVEKYYDTLPAQEQTAFAQLLDQADLDIMDWIMGRTDPPPMFTSLINRIRASGTADHGTP